MKRLLALALLLTGPAGAESFVLSTDSRLELLGAVQLLSPGKPPKGFSAGKNAATLELERRFAPWRTHPGVAANGALSRELDYRDRVELVGRLSPAFEPQARYFLPSRSIAAAGGRQRVDDWLAGLRAFAEEAGFEAYRAEAAKAEAAALEPARLRLEAGAFLVKIESYTGVAFQGSYAVTATAFLDKEVMLNDVWPREGGGYELRTVFGWDRSLALDDYFWKERLPAVLWHQYAHGLLDPLADLQPERLARLAEANKRVSWNSDWTASFKENIVRAVYIRLVTRELGPEAGARLREDAQEEANFPKTDELLARLQEYERSRDKHPTLAVFYPRLLDVFEGGAR